MFKKAERFNYSKTAATSRKKLGLNRSITPDEVPGPGAYVADLTPTKPKQSVFGFARSPKPVLHSKKEEK